MHCVAACGTPTCCDGCNVVIAETLVIVRFRRASSCCAQFLHRQGTSKNRWSVILIQIKTGLIWADNLVVIIVNIISECFRWHWCYLILSLELLSLRDSDTMFIKVASLWKDLLPLATCRRRSRIPEFFASRVLNRSFTPRFVWICRSLHPHCCSFLNSIRIPTSFLSISSYIIDFKLLVLNRTGLVLKLSFELMSCLVECIKAGNTSVSTIG